MIVQRNQPEEELQPTTNNTSVSVVKEPVPYMDYHHENGKPFPVDYYELGTTWNDPNGGFAQEISLIDSFIADQIKHGKLANDIGAVKLALRKIEKTANISREESPLSKITKTAAFVKFLMECDKVDFDINRYGK